MIELTGNQLASLVGTVYWPFLRIGALLSTAPIFSARMVPVRIRLVLAMALTWMIVPVLPPAPAIDPLSALGLMTTAQQIAIGIATGFLLQMVFAALVFGGQMVAMSMGLGFAAMVDPQNGVQVPVISQYYLILGTLFFLSIDGHLALIELIVAGFQHLPVGPIGLDMAAVWGVVGWAGNIFVGGVTIALPAVTAIMLTNLAFGVITRAAPQLNIFAVGFPVTILVGFVMVLLSIAHVLPRVEVLAASAMRMVGAFTGGG